METVGLIIMAALALYRLFTGPFFKDSITRSRSSGYRQDQSAKNQPTIQDTIKRKTGISNVSGYKRELWIGHKHEGGLKTYYMLARNAMVLAQTTINGSIYPGRYPAIHRLILAMYSEPEGNEGYQTLLYGSVDDDFNIVIPPIYHELKFEKNYYAIVKKDERYGVYSAENKLVVPVDYENIIHDDLNRRFLAQKWYLLFI